MSDLLLVLGNPIKHSKSPLIHNYWLKKYKINARYDKKCVKKEELKKYVALVKQEKLKGCNITVPYKKDFFDLVDKVDRHAQSSLAINTVFTENEMVIGTNTDGLGFVSSLIDDLNYNLRSNLNIFCLGAGGASYGIISELLKYKPNSVEVSNRTYSSTLNLVKHFCKEKDLYKKIIKPIPWGANPKKHIDLVINTTTCGMNETDEFPIEFNELSKQTFVYDIIYSPKDTILMKKARLNNLRTSNGIYMLIRQAAVSFEKWFNINLNNDDINEVIRLLGYDH